ncbi:MAG: DUF3800 domain-containing protein, partial [Thermomicrobiales bacterium]|nr:DUF3800 domain-containing protein [Thermomicrobiales bacterium]
MSRVHYFVDEAGNFDFSDKPGASKYFILTSVKMTDCSGADALISLRREFEWSGVEFDDGAFHATSDKQAVRDEVFKRIVTMDIRVDTWIIEKLKAHSDFHTLEGMYNLAWNSHTQHTLYQAVPYHEELHIYAGSIGVKKKNRNLMISQIRSAVHDTGRDQRDTVISICEAKVDPGLQVADYCCWAIQRKWERNDTRSYDLIQHK